MKKILLLICSVIITISIQAQNEWMEGPGKYVTANTKIIYDPTSPCNEGEEAFRNFIPKFRRDAQFRKSRVKFASDDESARSCFEYFDNWHLLKAQQRSTKQAAWYSTWYGITTDQVCLEYSEWPTDLDAEWGGSGMYARFQRINGKWYLTGFIIAG